MKGWASMERILEKCGSQLIAPRSHGWCGVEPFGFIGLAGAAGGRTLWPGTGELGRCAYRALRNVRL
jgi:hypothetical protein